MKPGATSVVIIGAGFAGIGAAIQLRKSGVDDIVILEREGEIGGTWRDNTYPGAGCDIPSLLYSYSFAPNPTWSRAYSNSAEILNYIHHIAEKFDITKHIQLDTNVTGVAYDETAGTWTIDSADGRKFFARTVIMAPGPLSNASFPDIRGIETYLGRKILSARWDHDYDVRDKNIAVIGTGASAVQIIPELAKTATSVKVFQRTAGWVLPKIDYRTPRWGKTLFHKVPATQSAARQAWFLGHDAAALALVWDTAATSLLQSLSRAYLRRKVKDPWLRRQLTPDFRAGCKRMLISNDYYDTLQRDNCKLISWPIATICPDGIRTSDGIEHQVDAIVFATGYDVVKTGTPFPVTGRGGRVLTEEWSAGAKAYKSVSVSGYPNLFLTFGPNSGPGHNSALMYMECQIDYIVKAINFILDRDLHALEVSAQSQQDFNRAIQHRLRNTTWNSGCQSWYLTEDGYNASMYPGFATQFAKQMSELDLADYLVTEAG